MRTCTRSKWVSWCLIMTSLGFHESLVVCHMSLVTLGSIRRRTLPVPPIAPSVASMAAQQPAYPDWRGGFPPDQPTSFPTPSSLCHSQGPVMEHPSERSSPNAKRMFLYSDYIHPAPSNPVTSSPYFTRLRRNQNRPRRINQH